jgi:hypothetical protein
VHPEGGREVTATGTVLALNPDATFDQLVMVEPIRLDALHEALRCRTVQLVTLGFGVEMWMDEEGKLVPHPAINMAATWLAKRDRAIARGDWVAGRVLITRSDGEHSVGLLPSQLDEIRNLIDPLWAW